MKAQGTVIRWDDTRGFGFIRSSASTADVFFHARDFRGGAGLPPREGLQVAFDIIHVGGKGPRAMAVQPASAARAAPGASKPAPRRVRTNTERRGRAPRSPAWVALSLMLGYGALLVVAASSKAAPWWILPASAGLSLLAFFAYWRDKHAAEQGRWRTPENVLHAWSLAGGWPGAWLAQQLLRHKSSKPSFLLTYWLTVAAHVGAVSGWLWWSLRA